MNTNAANMGSGTRSTGNNKGVETVVSSHLCSCRQPCARLNLGGRMATAKVTDADRGRLNKTQKREVTSKNLFDLTCLNLTADGTLNCRDLASGWSPGLLLERQTLSYGQWRTQTQKRRGSDLDHDHGEMYSEGSETGQRLP